ncbi:hypothetical protein [Faecalibacterium sp.]|jgi:hypothetical protein|uniref:hypothetical protein n=1 Tax=Faecalibacterium sp. TaxID=1971605 RepID=UPI00082190C9|nr:hypothetical protein [uncultured Faecalibacterium sp.]SCI17149.1 Beta-galactosidase [uncultured Faecalibacterium sp.]
MERRCLCNVTCNVTRDDLAEPQSSSIILWGVRINESVDDDAFYNRTNKIAHQLNPSRATSGVRYHRRAAGNAGALFLHAHSVEQQTSQTRRSGLFAISK